MSSRDKNDAKIDSFDVKPTLLEGWRPAIFLSLSRMNDYTKCRDTDTNFVVVSQSANLNLDVVSPPSVTPLSAICLEDLATLLPEISPPAPTIPSRASLIPPSPPSTPTLPPPQPPATPTLPPPPANNSSSSSSTPQAPRGTKRRIADDVILEKLDPLKQLREEGQAQACKEDLRFAQAMADMLQKLPPRQKSEAKFRIHQLLFEMEQALYKPSEE